ncbi:hypothetical protein RCL_jg2879.t1 [Rhizophagus clarus]|uniref:HAT C-terminal dimerisation domain-containing protein n=1 Tax=Rhizophagus clarus TaxID=94130 RepID=A0A8H3M722_9GLOM|nr:hypothetical protein RCL_jg2879.t1 [Rhizophagus clarus]
MEELVNLLRLFKEVTTFLSGSNYPTFSLIHLTISTIKSIFKSDDLLLDENKNKIEDFSNTLTILDNEKEESNEEELLEQPENDNDEEIILQALYNYWNVPSNIALKAAFLDPRFKDLTFARSKKDQIIHLIQDELNLANQTNRKSFT